MPRRHQFLTVFLLALTCAASVSVRVHGSSYTLLHTLFDPGTTVWGGWQGYSVAADQNLAVAGAPHDAVGGYGSGAVKVYDASSGTLLHTITNPSPSTFSYFGISVAVSGMRLVVGADQDDTGALDSGAAYVYDLASVTPTMPVAILTNPTLEAYANFGGAVAAAGNRVVVGASKADAGATNAGAAYVYDLASATPTIPLLTLTNPAPQPDDYFGSSVAISGTRVVISAMFKDAGAFNSGSVFVYDLSGAEPAVPIATLTKPDPQMFAAFGSSVAASGTRMVVGSAAGSVYIYDLTNAGATNPIAILTSPALFSYDEFGLSVALCGTRLVIGAYQDNTGAPGSGAAYTYDLGDGALMIPPLMLTNPVPAADGRFGWSVAVSGTRVIVGGYERGSAYVYDLASATPKVPATTLNNASPAPGDYFGASAALSGRWLVVGAYGENYGAEDGGSAYAYDLVSATPTSPLMILTNPAPQAFDYFGNSVAISGTRAVVGAFWDRVRETNVGSAYVYDLASARPTVPVITLNIPTPSGDDRFGNSVAISGALVVVGAPHHNNTGSAYLYDLTSTTPSVPLVALANPRLAVFDYFGNSVAISGTLVVIGAPSNDGFGAKKPGRAYVYDFACATPSVPVLTLTNPGPPAVDYFGYSVAIDGVRVVVGSPHDNTGATNAGSVFVYDLASAEPNPPIVRLNNPSPAEYNSFGYSVTLSEARVAVGFGAGNVGSVYVYDLTSATPSVPVAQLANPCQGADDDFGHTLAVDGTRLLVGARRAYTIAPDRGAAYVFGIGPELRITLSAPGFATISWTPTNSPGFVLQYTRSLAANDWSNAPSGAANPITISVTNGLRAYRLHQP